MDPFSAVFCCLITGFTGFFIAGIVSTMVMRYGPDALEQATLFGCVTAVFATGVAIYLSYGSPTASAYDVVWAAFAVFYLLSAAIFGKRVPGDVRKLIRFADDIGSLGQRLFDVLDVDDDGVISERDIVNGWVSAQEAGISRETLSTLLGHMCMIGHDVGIGDSRAWLLTLSEVEAAPAKVRQEFEAWLPHLG